jgi:hypothetical protein
MDRKNFNKSFFENKSSSNGNSRSNSSFSIGKFLLVLFIILIILIIIYVVLCLVKYYQTSCYKKKDFFTYLFDFNDNNVCLMDNAPYTPPPKRDAPVISKPVVLKEKKPSELSELLGKKEVFHIGNQDYTYDQSRCKCSSYGARLATVNEMKQAYNNGANWCSYGWTEGQNAYYPVQKCYHQSLKEKRKAQMSHLMGGENKEGDFLENSDQYCGKPGLNGGFFANPELKFGANCYGVKPKGDVVKLKDPVCDKEKNFCDLKSNFQASHILETDNITAFNNDSWNMN